MRAAAQVNKPSPQNDSPVPVSGALACCNTPIATPASYDLWTKRDGPKKGRRRISPCSTWRKLLHANSPGANTVAEMASAPRRVSWATRINARPFGQLGATRHGHGTDRAGAYRQAHERGSILDMLLLVQNQVQQRPMNLDMAIVGDETQLPEPVHEEADARARRSNHFGE